MLSHYPEKARNIIIDHYRENGLHYKLVGSREIGLFWQLFTHDCLDNYIKKIAGYDSWAKFKQSEHVGKIYDLPDGFILVFADFVSLNNQ